MKGGLRETALPFVMFAFAGEQTFAEDDFRALEGAAFLEGTRLREKNLANVIGMREEVEMLRSEFEVNDVAVFAREPREKRDRIALHGAEIRAGDERFRTGRVR